MTSTNQQLTCFQWALRLRFPPPAPFLLLDLKGITHTRFFVYPAYLRWGACASGAVGGRCPKRVLVHVGTEHAREKLINRRLAYVAVSRARHDVRLYTNDKTRLTEQLSRDVSHRSAMEQNAGIRHTEDRTILEFATRGRANSRAGTQHWALAAAEALSKRVKTLKPTQKIGFASCPLRDKGIHSAL
jgi:hypothetical protein